jgi:elongator complex protein 3
LRLRFPSPKAHRPEVDRDTAIIRELHVYGPEVPIGKRSQDAWQHVGYGHQLLATAENIARDRGARRILVLSALGTKRYYRHVGYDYVGAYMGKYLK